MIQIKALACELPYRRGLPLSRFSISEIKREAISQGLVASIGQTTVWRWLSQDAINRHFPYQPLRDLLRVSEW